MPTDIQSNDQQIEQNQQQSFIDASPFLESNRASIPKTADVTENGMDISHFFERPILIQSYEWDDNTDFFNTVSPWLQYFQHAAIRPKLLGFSRLTADLEVELRINGSPFRFAQLLVSYRPLFTHNKTYSGTSVSLSDYSGGYLTEDGCVSGNTSVLPTGSSNFSILARSQRQCTYMDVATSTGGKLVLPFIHPFNALRVNSLNASESSNLSTIFGEELLSMGTMTIESLSTLRNMQTATTVGATIDIFVRAINVRAWLASGVATADPQGAERKPSEVASVVSSVASLFKHIPIIGTYATLAETIAGAGSKVLQFFGYTPRPDTSLPQYVTGYSYPIESSVTFPKKVRNLGLDHENNVVVDPGVIDGDSADPLALASFCARPTLLARTYFSAPLGVDDAIFLLPICPFHSISQLITSANVPTTRRFQMTPCALAAMNFRYWRGTMCVRFQAIKTAFHRGRLRVTWEPEIGNSTTSAQAPLFTRYEGYQQILNWDLAAQSAITVKIGFGARKGRLTVPRLGVPGLTDSSFITNTEASPTAINSGTITVDNYEDYFNGFLRLSVLTRLQAPDVSYPVPIMAHVWYEDMEFYDPLENGPSLTTIAAHSGTSSTLPADTTSYYGTVMQGEDIENLMTRSYAYDTMYPQGEEVDEFVFQPTSVVENALYEGEKVASLRSLLQRDVFYDSIAFEIPRVGINASIAGAPRTVHLDIPPTLCTRMLPSYPHPYGTTAPSRSNVQTAGAVAPSYTFTGSSAIARDFCLNMARTNLFPLIRECFIGFRGSYNWKFVPIIENGCKIRVLTASRANFTHSSHTRIGSFPRNQQLSPWSSTPAYGGVTDGPSFMGFSESVVRPLIYDTGTNIAMTPANTIGTRGLYYSIQNKLTDITRFLNGYLGSFASGSLAVFSNEQRTLGIRMPFFSNTRFHPGSTTGWMNANCNSELSQNIRLTVITEGTPNLIATSVLGSPKDNPYSSDTSNVMMHGPTRSSIVIAAICSAGDDISFGGFVSVPTLYASSQTAFLSTAQTNS